MIDAVVVGAVNWDINLLVERFPDPGGEVVVREITRVPGGKAGNVAVAVARLLGRDRAAIIAGLGKDDLANRQIEIFEAEGVDTSGLLLIEGCESGQAYIVVDGRGENVIHTYFGANARIRLEDVLEAKRIKLLEEAKIVTVIDPPLQVAEMLMKLGKDKGKITILDPGVLVEHRVDGLANVLKYADYVVLNENEAGSLIDKDPAKVSSILKRINPQIRPIIKQGARGCVLANETRPSFFHGVDVAQLGFKVVNTVGCGDAFLGAFIAGKVRHLDDHIALNWANWAGALKATSLETRGSPTWQQLSGYVSID